MFSGRFSGCRATVLGRRFNQVASAAQTEALKPVLIDKPEFKQLGSPASLLSIDLPPSAVLKLRTNSILAASGDINTINTKLSILNDFKPIVYNEISCSTPVSLIISNKREGDSFVNLELKKEDNWRFFNSANLIGWYGDLAIAKHKKLISVQGEGDLVLKGVGQTYTVNLDQNESIYLNPTSLIGFNSHTSGPAGASSSVIGAAASAIAGRGSSSDEFYKLHTSKLNLELPKLKWVDYLKIAGLKQYHRLRKLLDPKYEVQASESTAGGNSNAVVAALKSAGAKISQLYQAYFYKNKVFYKITGPSTVLIQNHSESVSRVFTRSELDDIYKNLK